MSMKKSLSLALLAILTSLVSLGLTRYTPTRGQVKKLKRPFSIAGKEIKSVQLIRGNEDLPYVVLDRQQDGRWQVVFPKKNISDLANPRVIDELMALIKIGRLKKAVGVKPAQAGLAGDNYAYQIVVYGEDGNDSLFVGNSDPAGKFRYVATETKRDVVQQMPNSLFRLLDRKRNDFRQLMLVDLNKEKLTKIALHPGGKSPAGATIVMAETGKGWFLNAPVQWPVEPQTLERVVRILQEQKAFAVVADRVHTQELAQYGLGADAPNFTLTLDGKEVALRFGKSVPNSKLVYAWRQGRAQVYSINRTALMILERGQKRADWVTPYRNTMVGILHQSPKVLRIKTKDGTIDFTHEGKRWLTSGARTWRASANSVEKLIQILQRLKVIRFMSEDSSQAVAYGLGKPGLKIIGLDPANSVLGEVSFSVPDAKGRVFFKLGGTPQIMEIHPLEARLLKNVPLGLRSPHLTRFDYRTISEIRLENVDSNPVKRTFVRRGNNWEETTPGVKHILNSEDHVALEKIAIISSRLSATQYLAENVSDLKKFGLDQPQLHVIVKADSGTGTRVALNLLVGNMTKMARVAERGRKKGRFIFYASVQGTREVFALSETIVKILKNDL